jgi:hypothetical protein
VPRSKDIDTPVAPLWVKCVNAYLRPRLKSNGEREDAPAHPVPQRRRTGTRHLNV